MKGFGCICVLAVGAIALLSVALPGAFGAFGLYALVIGKGAVDGMLGQAMFAKIVRIDAGSGNAAGVFGPAVVAYQTAAGERREATVATLPRPMSRPYHVGEPIPVLISRLDPTKAQYDAMWANRPEHQARLAPIWKMAVDNSNRSRRARGD